jgi:endonuclease G
MKGLSIILISFLFVKISYAQFNYLPATIPGHQVVKYTQFTLSYNEKHEQADWVAYELDKAEAKMEAGRCNCFHKDTNITTGSSTPEDYANSGFDKGHLSPSEDNQLSAANNRESFLMSNMSPQLHRFNNGKWKELETWVRDKAIEYDTIYIVSGPVFVNNLGTIGADSVTIPGYFYKVLLRFKDGSPKMIAFLIPQIAAIGELKDYVVPVNALESITGIDFFPALPASVENRAEASESLTQWGL